MPFVSVTRLRLRSWLFLPSFFYQTLFISRQAAKSPGNLHVDLLRDDRNAMWTCTTWDSENAMKAFMLAKPHGPVMRKLINWCDEGAVAHWTQPEPEPPSWPEAHRRLLKDGRRSKVNHPSAAHTAFDIPPPNTALAARYK